MNPRWSSGYDFRLSTLGLQERIAGDRGSIPRRGASLLGHGSIRFPQTPLDLF